MLKVVRKRGYYDFKYLIKYLYKIKVIEIIYDGNDELMIKAMMDDLFK